MTIRCSVKGCNSIYNKGCNNHFFSFPVKNADLLKKWIAAIGEDKDFQPSTANRICHLHFEISDFFDTPGIRRKILKHDKFPTRNLTLIHDIPLIHDEKVQNDPLNDLHEMIEMQYEIHEKNQQHNVSTPEPEPVEISITSENITERLSIFSQSQ